MQTLGFSLIFAVATASLVHVLVSYVILSLSSLESCGANVNLCYRHPVILLKKGGCQTLSSGSG